MTNLTRRIKQLEGAAHIHDLPTFVVVLDHSDEPSEAAIARFRRQHPETPDDARFVLFVSGFTARPADVAEPGHEQGCAFCGREPPIQATAN